MVELGVLQNDPKHVGSRHCKSDSEQDHGRALTLVLVVVSHQVVVDLVGDYEHEQSLVQQEDHGDAHGHLHVEVGEEGGVDPEAADVPSTDQEELDSPASIVDGSCHVGSAEADDEDHHVEQGEDETHAADESVSEASAFARGFVLADGHLRRHFVLQLAREEH